MINSIVGLCEGTVNYINQRQFTWSFLGEATADEFGLTVAIP